MKSLAKKILGKDRAAADEKPSPRIDGKNIVPGVDLTSTTPKRKTRTYNFK